MMRDLRSLLTPEEAAEIPPDLCGLHDGQRDITCHDCITLFTLREVLKMRRTYEDEVRAFVKKKYQAFAAPQKRGPRPRGLDT